MGLLDIEDVDELYVENYVQEESNCYLANTEDALSLIAKIIPLKKDKDSHKEIQRLDNMLDVDFLSTFSKVQLKNEAHLQMQLAFISDKLIEQKKYSILRNKSVVGLGGKFSAGKSKFINSILKAGEELLPEDQNPTTSIPTYIVYGNNDKICAYTSDNEEIVLDLEALQALTHKFYEKYSMGFSSFVNSLIISEADMPYKKLVFLDTPGYSKADSGGKGKNQKKLTDENKAFSQLRSADYLIWLMDIENGDLSETDIAFISKLRLDTPILIVVNKSDKKIDEEIEQVVKQVESTARNAGIKLYAVTAYSSRNNEEWRSAGLIEEFLKKAMLSSTNKEDILTQIAEIEESISKELHTKIEKSKYERNLLSDIIFKSDDIIEIKTLVELYGESMEEVRDLEECEKKYKQNMKNLKKSLEDFYGRRQNN